MSAVTPNLLQNYFEGVARATLIQDQTKMSNVDSPHRPIGFDYCAIAMRQRVLQHIQSSIAGREERRTALTHAFPNLRMIEDAGREQGLPIEDILDATVACWSASRLAAGIGRGLPETVTVDTTGLPMVIWV
jgi:predicted RNase H-like nuclease